MNVILTWAAHPLPAAARRVLLEAAVADEDWTAAALALGQGTATEEELRGVLAVAGLSGFFVLHRALAPAHTDLFTEAVLALDTSDLRFFIQATYNLDDGLRDLLWIPDHPQTRLALVMAMCRRDSFREDWLDAFTPTPPSGSEHENDRADTFRLLANSFPARAVEAVPLVDDDLALGLLTHLDAWVESAGALHQALVQHLLVRFSGRERILSAHVLSHMNRLVDGAVGSWIFDDAVTLLEAGVASEALRARVRELWPTGDLPVRARLRQWAREGNFVEAARTLATHLDIADELNELGMSTLEPRAALERFWKGSDPLHLAAGRSPQWCVEAAAEVVRHVARGKGSASCMHRLERDQAFLDALGPEALTIALTDVVSQGGLPVVPLVVAFGNPDLLKDAPVGRLSTSTAALDLVLPMAIARFGESLSAWECFSRLSENWPGTLGELLEVCAEL